MYLSFLREKLNAEYSACNLVAAGSMAQVLMRERLTRLFKDPSTVTIIISSSLRVPQPVSHGRKKLP